MYGEAGGGGKDDIISLISSSVDEGDGGYVERNHEYSCQKCRVEFASRD